MRNLALWGCLLLTLAGIQLCGCAALEPCADCMHVPVREMTCAEYPDDPSGRSVQHGNYNGRRLVLMAGSDGKHFDFIFEPTDPRVARVVFRDVDVSLMTPGLPEYVRGDKGLERIALVDRQWNRQQVKFSVPGPHVEVTGGDGFEVENLTGAALAKNCLNAGLWEVLLSVEEDGKKRMYYQGWFTFPLGQYKRLWERNTGLSYCWDDLYWCRMEHWLDPSGTPIALDRLRSVQSEEIVDARFSPSEPILYAGEQVRKAQTSNLVNQQTWGDVLSTRGPTFATFRQPGYYDLSTPWGNEFWRLASYEKTIVRSVQCPARPDKVHHEIELVFRPECGHLGKPAAGQLANRRARRRLMNGGRSPVTRIIIGGIDLDALPVLRMSDYPKGLYMPMGIGVPPFYQTYEQLQANPPCDSPYYAFVLNEKDQWIDHHKAAIDGPVMHRDADNPDIVHLYLLSYERHTLIAHFVLPIAAADSVADARG